MPIRNPARYRWFVVALLFWCAALNYGDRTAISSVFPLLRRDLGMSDVALGAIGSLFLWSYAIGSPFAGWLADRWSRSRMIAWSLAGWSVTTGLTACVHTSHQLLALRVLLGAAECFYLPAAVALLAEYHQAGSRGTAMAFHMAGLSIGMVAGGAAGGYLGEHYGWRALFVILGAAGILMALFARLFLRDKPVEPEREAAFGPVTPPFTMLEVLGTPSFQVIVAQAAIVSMSTWMFYNWLPLFYEETFGMSLSAAGFSGTFMIQASGTLGFVLGGPLSDRVAKGKLANRMLLQAVCYLAAAPFLLAFGFSRSFTLVSVCIFCYSLLRGLGSTNEHPVVCDVLAPRLRATAVGLMNSANCLAGGIGTLAAGFLKKDYGLGGIFATVPLMFLLASALLFAGFRYVLPKDLARAAAIEETPPAPHPRAGSRR